jgi:Fic family protein
MIESSGHLIYASPQLTAEDFRVLDSIQGMRRDLVAMLRPSKRWEGGLRRSMLAKAIRGSNSIEGYLVEEDDAAAALADEDPLSADEQTFAEIRGYRQALGFVLQMAQDRDFVFDASVLRGMHYMMLSHDLSKSPGRYRTGPIYVHDESSGRIVYEGAGANDVAGLMARLVTGLDDPDGVHPLVRAAMAHLNLVMIHPFRDGNGRMARALQTLVLARNLIVEPEFASIEEWLGANTDDYYRVLALTGQGAWHPRPDANLWVSFNLRAHHLQAQTLRRRIDETDAIWQRLDTLVADHHLPERVVNQLYEAVLGYRLRRSGYVRSAEVDDRTATRDLARLVDLDILASRGQTRGRHYVAGPTLATLAAESRAGRRPLEDPYPWMRAELLKGDEYR